MQMKKTLSAGGLTVLTVAALMAVHDREAGAQSAGSGTAPVRIVSPLPLPVADAAEASRTPVQFLLVSGITYQIPTGKRLTMEFVTVQCLSSPSNQGTYVQIETVVGGVDQEHMLTLEPLLPFAGQYQFGSARTVRMYGDPGTVVKFAAVPGGTSDCRIVFSGVLSDV